MRLKLRVGAAVAAVLLASGIIYTTTLSSRAPHQAAAPGAMAGRVLDVEGRPVVGAKVYADRNTAPMGRRPYVLTDDGGGFQIKDLVPGTYTVSAEKEEEGYAPSDSTFYTAEPLSKTQVTVQEQQTVTDVIVRFGSKVAKIKGKVKNATGEPVGDAVVTLCREDRPDNCYRTSLNQPDEEGAFELLVPSAPIKIEVSAPGYRTWIQKYSESEANALRLTPGAVKKLDVLLRRDK